MQGKLVYKWLSALLCYPEADLLAALPEFRQALAESPELAKNRAELTAFLEYFENTKLLTLQEKYVETFDCNRHHALYIFEHVHGEDRDRGLAMVDLLEEYRKYGYELGNDELPDYLPALLEFFAYVDADTAQKLLDDAVHVIAHIANKLEASESPYAVLLKTAVSLSTVKPLPLTEPPIRDMDEAMETFGPNIEGVEPLLKPKVNFTDANPVRFYPEGYYKQHSAKN